MKRNRIASAVLAAAILCVGAGYASVAMGQSENPSGQAQLVVTVKSHQARPLQQSDVAVKVNNRPADILSWTPLTGENAALQLIFLFDESARTDLSLQIPTLRKFIESLPPTTAVAVAYMDNGRAVMAQTLTTDHALAAKALRITNGIPGITGSPYFCLSDLAKHYWPPNAKTPRRVVFMVTNGQDPYYETPDLQDPYVTSAIQDSQKAGLLVYSLYFANRGFADRSSFRITFDQSRMERVSNETGGEFYSLALTSPVSFEPYLKQFRQSLRHQYSLAIAAGHSGWQQVGVKSNLPGVKLAAAHAIYVR